MTQFASSQSLSHHLPPLRGGFGQHPAALFYEQPSLSLPFIDNALFPATVGRASGLRSTRTRLIAYLIKRQATNHCHFMFVFLPPFRAPSVSTSARMVSSVSRTVFYSTSDDNNCNMSTCVFWLLHLEIAFLTSLFLSCMLLSFLSLFVLDGWMDPFLFSVDIIGRRSCCPCY